MPDCPLADDCPNFTERIAGMGCQHLGDRGGKLWCQHYNQPIEDLKTQPVKPGEEVVVDVDDMHQSGAGVGRTEEGFIVLVNGVVPDARSRVKITEVHSNHARAEEVERLPMEPEEDEADADALEADAEAEERTRDDKNRRERLGSRDNFWGS